MGLLFILFQGVSHSSDFISHYPGMILLLLPPKCWDYKNEPLWSHHHPLPTQGWVLLLKFAIKKMSLRLAHWLAKRRQLLFSQVTSVCVELTITSTYINIPTALPREADRSLAASSVSTPVSPSQEFQVTGQFSR